MEQQDITPHLFRTEYGKIVAVLCKTFDLKHIEVAEDIAADTFLKASEVWALKGIPQNPAAWLYTVAKNKARDHIKRLAIYEKQVQKQLATEEQEPPPEIEFSRQVIADSQLAMLFAVCDPANPTKAQICLALQILCGFSIKEIANAFLTKTETIKKSLQRAREVLRKGRFEVKPPGRAAVIERSGTVLTTLYLLFNEGYFSRSADRFIRKELCAEALRLLLILADDPLTDTSQTQALLALMYFQSSRLDARTDDDEEAILLHLQDTGKWDKTLIGKGNRHLISAFESGEVSRYHLEAAIAYWHTAPAAKNKWENILKLYEHLLLIQPSPIAELNRVFAFAQVHGNRAAIQEALMLDVPHDLQYHALLGHLYTGIDADEAICNYQYAMELSVSVKEKKLLAKAIERMRSGG